MRIFIPVCLILMLFAGCGTLKNMDYFRIRQRSKIISTNFHKEHSFRENRPLIIIPVEIRGKTYDFIFDTGAASTVISRELANELGLKKKADVVSGDSRGNSREMMVSLIDTVSIGGVHFGDIAVAVVDWPEYSMVECLGPAGLIGNNLIRHCNWLVDYKENKLIISDGDLQKEGMHYVEMQHPNGRPYINLKADSLEIKSCLLDLGSGGSLDVSKDMVESKSWNWKKYPYVYDIDGSSQGLFGAKMDTTIKVKIDSITIGGYTIFNPVVDLESKSGSKIGSKILEKAILHLDYTNARVGFLPYDSVPEYAYLERLGFSPMLDSAGLYIASVTKGSELWEKGIRYGDRILKLNGLKASDFNGLCDYMDYLMDPGNKEKEITLVMSDDPEAEIKIANKNLWAND